MADPLGDIDEDAPPEPVIPLDPELEVCSSSSLLPTQACPCADDGIRDSSRNYGPRELVSLEIGGLNTTEAQDS